MKSTFCIGMMSGTSLDGMDLCYVQFWENKTLQYNIIHAKTYAYTNHWRTILKEAFHKSKDELQDLDREFGSLIAENVLDFMSEFSIQNVDFIASHGQTIHHQPEKAYTLQIGDGQTIANHTKQLVVNDFRTQDVLFGGQGAPLVPIGDALLFAEYDACINIGGFANISFEQNNQRIAFDICPANIVLNELTQRLGFPYDENGNIARNNSVNTNILKQLNSLEYYSQIPPKSLGLEWTNEYIFPLLTDEIKVQIATFTQHISDQIAQVVTENNLQNVLLSGGGTYNTFLVELLQNHKKCIFTIPDSITIEYKEALIFALLGYLRLHGKTNVLASVTGATHNHSSGKIWKPL